MSGLVPPIGSVGNANDNALAETTIRLHKNETVRADSPARPTGPSGDVELLTINSVFTGSNTDRLIHRLAASKH
ncbi:hypothetical protein MTY66_54130 [Mycolicibacterium sp. TY66]|nr:hypothetical protein MTY66_54130 [Mycolicibacterium sp. TY66]BCJ84594.1 hypothetical protein MTY81_59670 [Mycolicibacterium sp. TY81]